MPRDEPPRLRQRAETTKAAILAAARERFAAEGYDKATVRSIAADAGADPALVIRYFGSKDRLFAEAVDFDLQLPDLGTFPKSRQGEALAAHFLRRWDDDEALPALLRTAVTNDAVAERLRGIFAQQVAPAILKWTQEPPAIAGMRAGLVASQLMGLALTRYVLRLPAVAGLDRDEVIRLVGPTLQRYLNGKLDQAPERQKPPRLPADG